MHSSRHGHAVVLRRHLNLSDCCTLLFIIMNWRFNDYEKTNVHSDSPLFPVVEKAQKSFSLA